MLLTLCNSYRDLQNYRTVFYCPFYRCVLLFFKFVFIIIISDLQVLHQLLKTIRIVYTCCYVCYQNTMLTATVLLSVQHSIYQHRRSLLCFLGAAAPPLFAVMVTSTPTFPGVILTYIGSSASYNNK